jgi:two-component system chemotaxis response regulator CheY
MEVQKHILVVDDSPTTLKLVCELLKNDGSRLTTCSNGEEARYQLLMHNFDLIISDEEMPKLKGSELARWLRTEVGNTELPFILMTGKNDPHLFAELLSKKFITVMFPKPFQHLTFLNMVNNLLGIQKDVSLKKSHKN